MDLSPDTLNCIRLGAIPDVQKEFPSQHSCYLRAPRLGLRPLVAAICLEVFPHGAILPRIIRNANGVPA